MTRQNEGLFEFGPFILDGIEQSLVRDDKEIPLPPKAFALLLLLVANAGRTLEKSEIMETVWPEVFVEEQNLVWTIHLLRKVLGDDANSPKYIATKLRRGYRFIADVRKQTGESPSPSTEEAAPPAESDPTKLIVVPDSSGTPKPLPKVARPSRRLTFFSEDRWFLFTSCSLYGLLYVVALLTEVAYEFEDYRSMAMKGAPLVFLWTATTSLLGLIVCRRRTSRGQTNGLTLAILIFSASALALYASVIWFLPNVPITKALFSTYPAQGAYLKNIYYFFLLAVVFLVLPYHFIVAARNEVRTQGAKQMIELLSGRGSGTAPKGTVFLNVNWLGLMLIIAAGGSIAATAHLLENLVPSEHTNFFTQLVQWRLVLYFSLGLVCLIWYSRSLNIIKSNCLKVAGFDAN